MSDPQCTTLPLAPGGQTGGTGLRSLVESRSFNHTITAVIVVNAITLGLETSESVMATKLFGSEFPQWFGSVGASMFSL